MAIIIGIISFFVAIGIVMGVYFLFIRQHGNKTTAPMTVYSDTNITEVQGADHTSDKTEATIFTSVETTSAVTMTETTAAATLAPNTTIPAATASPATMPPATQPQKNTVETLPHQQGITISPGGAYMVGYNTPFHAGLVLREHPGSSYNQIAIVDEGTAVLYTGQQEGSYILVNYYINGSFYSGWLLSDYLTENTSGHDYYNGTSVSVSSVHISYNTPGHAGLVMRADSTYYSASLGVLPEGTLLYLLEKAENNYSLVRTSDGTTGWVLSQYLN